MREHEEACWKIKIREGAGREPTYWEKIAITSLVNNGFKLDQICLMLDEVIAEEKSRYKLGHEAEELNDLSKPLYVAGNNRLDIKPIDSKAAISDPEEVDTSRDPNEGSRRAAA